MIKTRINKQKSLKKTKILKKNRKIIGKNHTMCTKKKQQQ